MGDRAPRPGTRGLLPPGICILLPGDNREMATDGRGRIGILTGGGDCPGLNAVIRAVVRRALMLGYEVYGIKNGWLGLVKGTIEPLDLMKVSGILPRGGTILGTSRTNPLKKDEDKKALQANMENFSLD